MNAKNQCLPIKKLSIHQTHIAQAQKLQATSAVNVSHRVFAIYKRTILIRAMNNVYPVDNKLHQVMQEKENPTSKNIIKKFNFRVKKEHLAMQRTITNYNNPYLLTSIKNGQASRSKSQKEKEKML